MYSLKCEWYPYSFKTLGALLDNILENGMDPNYEITLNGVGTGETAWDILGPTA
jgi:hypothetical protein